MKALLLENIHAEGARVLTEAGFEVTAEAGAMTESQLLEVIDQYDVIGIRSRTHLTEPVLAAATNLQAIGAFCIGTNQIDLDSASRHGIAVFNAPYSNTRSVVELAIAEIISMARHLTDKNAAMHQGIWDKSAKGAHEVRGRTLGIVGYGSIGSQLSVVAEALGMKVYFYDIADRLAMGNAQQVSSLAELLQTCETVSVHVDGRPENANLFGAEEFAMMRPRSLFLNLCRGHVVDHEALVANLESGHLAGAAIDVYPTEPKNPDEPFVSPLQHLDNVILTPHIGGSTQEAQTDIGRFVAAKLVEYASTGATSMSVNLPNIAPLPTSTARIAHLHRNVPGVMGALNNLFGELGVNVESQSLATQGQLGYAVADVRLADAAQGEQLLAAIERMDQTVRVRLLEPEAR